MKIERSSGILLHITSLPGKYGIGTFGSEAYEFVDFLILSRQKIWQMLPLGHTGFGDSPYQCFSAFAGNPLLINLEKLKNEGFLDAEDIDNIQVSGEDKIDYHAVMTYKYKILRIAYHNFKGKASKVDKAKFDIFCKDHKSWLDDYTAFIAIKDHFHGKAWYKWEEDIRKKEKNAFYKYVHQLKSEIEFYKLIQYFFFKQWQELKAYANHNHISIMGDIPLYVAHDSVEAWSNPELFLFDEEKNPLKIAGVPPDYFSETGQLWGNPLYNWETHKETKFNWWVERIRANFKLYDILRIDHFRGLSAYWAVPFGEKTAINGEWIHAPGKELLSALKVNLGYLPIVAEDLGVITPDVEDLRDSNGLPGMKILQFAFDSNEENNFLPHTYNNNCLVYTGTHDNDTCLGWFTSSKEEDKIYLRDYFYNVDEKDISWSFIKLAWSSVANAAMSPLQDILSLGNEARMNYPGTASGNWTWRFKKADLTDELAERLWKITRIYGR